MLEFLDAGEDARSQVGIGLHIDPRLARALQHHVPARQLAHLHAALVADQRWVDVLEGARIRHHSGHVHAALVGEGIGAHVWRPGIRREVGRLGRPVREPRQLLQAAGPKHLEAHLQRERRRDGDEVGVAAPLAPPVDGALNLPGPLLHRRQGVGHRALGIIVGVDAHARVRQRGHHLARDALDLHRQRGAVGVAQDHPCSPIGVRRAEALDRIIGVLLVGIEEVLGVVEDVLALREQERHRLADHREVLLARDLRHLLQVEVPGLAHDRGHRGEAVHHDPQPGVIRCRRATPAGHAECGNPGGAQVLALEEVEQLGILRVGRREAGLDHVHAHVRQAQGHLQLLAHRQAHPLALHAIAKGGVVEVDPLHQPAGAGAVT